jgi:hypothetical protein
MVTAAEVQAIIVDEVGDTDDAFLMSVPEGETRTRIALYWDSYASKARVFPRLQEAYTRRRAALAVRGHIRRNVGFQTPTLTVNLKEEAAHLNDIIAQAEAEIERLRKQARGQRSAQIGQLVTTAPELPPTWWQGRDANDPLYRGDPYVPGLPRRIQ